MLQLCRNWILLSRCPAGAARSWPEIIIEFVLWTTILDDKLWRRGFKLGLFVLIEDLREQSLCCSTCFIILSLELSVWWFTRGLKLCFLDIGGVTLKLFNVLNRWSLNTRFRYEKATRIIFMKDWFHLRWQHTILDWSALYLFDLCFGPLIQIKLISRLTLRLVRSSGIIWLNSAWKIFANS